MLKQKLKEKRDYFGMVRLVSAPIWHETLKKSMYGKIKNCYRLWCFSVYFCYSQIGNANVFYRS